MAAAVRYTPAVELVMLFFIPPANVTYFKYPYNYSSGEYKPTEYMNVNPKPKSCEVFRKKKPYVLLRVWEPSTRVIFGTSPW
jgi:hypothetical protein